MTKRRRRHTPEQIVKKLRDADAMLNAGKEEAVVLQILEISQSTYERWRRQYGGMKAEEAKRLKEMEEENRRLKHWWRKKSSISRCSNISRREIGKPFAEAGGGRRLAGAVFGFRTKGV